jgi:hypothetical protein
MAPTARSLKLLRDTGHAVGVVESWVPGANVRRDLFGFADLLAVQRVERTLRTDERDSLVGDASRRGRLQTCQFLTTCQSRRAAASS